MSQVRVVLKSVWDDKGIKNAQKSLEGISKGISTTFKAIGVAAVATTAAFAKLSGDSIKAASSLQESTNAVNVAFGKSAEAILAIGENSAQSLGLARTEFNQAAVRFSAFAERVVGEGGDVAGFIGDVTQRAADFASVFNIEVSEALQVFQSGLSGEAEPLKRFGINLLDSEVKAYALRAGIIGVGQAMTESQKVQARYGLLLESTAKTAGDFANTSDSLANRQRILKATFTDIQAEIGAAMLPALEKLVGVVVDDLLPVFRDLGDKVGPAVADILEFVAEVFKEAFTEGTDLNKSLDELAGSFDLLFGAITNGQRDAEGFSDFLSNLVYIVEFLVTTLASLIAGFQGFGIAMDALGKGDLDTVFKFLSMDTIEFIESVNGATDALEQINGVSLSRLRGQMGDLRVDGQRLVQQQRQLYEAMTGRKLPTLTETTTTTATETSTRTRGGGTSAFEKTQKIIQETQKKIRAATERFNEAQTRAREQYEKATAAATKRYNEEEIEETNKKNDALAKALVDHNANVSRIQQDFAQRQADIIQQSINRLRDAFAQAVRTNVADIFGQEQIGKSVDKLIANLRDRLTASRTLVSNASALAAQGFSQTFIEQVVGAGLETGNELSKAILEATPETQKELQSLFGTLESESETGMDSLAKTMFEKTGLATNELKKLFKQTQTDLADSLKQAQTDYSNAQTEIQTSFTNALAAAKKTRDEAFTSATDSLNEALKDAKDAYVKTLGEIRTAFDEQIKALKGQLGGLGGTIAQLLAQLASLSGAKVTPPKLNIPAGQVGNIADVPGFEAVQGVNVAAKQLGGAVGILIDEASDVSSTLAFLDSRVKAALSYADNIGRTNAAAAESARQTALQFQTQRTALAGLGEKAVGTVINVNVKTDSTQSLAMVGKTIGNTITKYVSSGGQVLVSPTAGK